MMPCEPWYAPGRLTQISDFSVRLGESINLLRVFMHSSSGSSLYPISHYYNETEMQMSADVKDLEAIR